MGNKEGKKTNTLIDQERNRQLQESAEAKSVLQPNRDTEYGWSQGLRDYNVEGYKSLVDGTGIAGYGAGAGGGGGVSVPKLSLDPRYAALEKGYKPLSQGIHQAMPGYSEFSKTGGLTPEIVERIRGKGVFDDFAKTGGYSDADISNTRARGIAPISGFYGNLKNEMARRQGVTGGRGVGLDTASARSARDAAIASSTAARDTELGLQGQIRSNKMGGAQALSGAEVEHAKLLQGGRLAGLGGLTDIGKFGYGGLEGVAARSQQINDANKRAAAAGANASRGNALAEQQYRDRMKLAGLSGLESVYGSSPAELARYDDELFRNRQLTQQGQGSNLNLRSEYNPNTSGWDRALQVGGIVAGAAGAALPYRRKSSFNPYANTGSRDE